MGKEGRQMTRMTSLLRASALAGVLLCAIPASAQQLFDHAIPPGANYDKAEFRMWLPPNTPKVRAILLLVPGSNGDGRPQAEDAF